MQKKIFSNLSFPKVALLFCIIGLCAYGNSIFHPFVHDDIVFIEKNPHISDWKNISSVFLEPASLFIKSSIVNIYYRPLLEILYRVEYRFFGLNPYWYHAFNLIIHIINAILIYKLFCLLCSDNRTAFIVGLIFLIHPVQTESVSCITGISNLIFFLLCIISFIFYVKSAERQNSPSANLKIYALSLIFFGLALFSKEQAIVIPFLIVLYEYCFNFLSRKSNYKTCIRIGGLFCILLSYVAFRKLILNNAAPPIFAYREELWLRILAIPKTLLVYLRLIFFPSGLHFYRTINILDKALLPTILLGIIVIAASSALFFMPRNSRRIAIFGLGWFIITLLPVLNIIPIVTEYSFIWTVEHFLYFPIVGLVLFLISVLGHYFKAMFQKRPHIIKWISVSIAVALVLVTAKQNTYWRGEIPLFERAVVFESHLARVHRLLAQAYYMDNRFDEAIKEYNASLRIMKGYLEIVEVPEARRFYLGFIKGLYFDLAHCYENKKDFESSIREYKKAITIDPEDSVLYNNLGTNYFLLADIDTAMKYFQIALSREPNNIDALNNLAVCHIYRGEPKEAEFFLRKILVIDANSDFARMNLEKLYGNSGPSQINGEKTGLE